MALTQKHQTAYVQLGTLLKALHAKALPGEIVSTINGGIEAINGFTGSEKEAGKLLATTQSEILKLLETELRLVTKGHYRNMWLAQGMAVFGMPLGVVFALILDNMAFIGIGLPLGMMVGMAVGHHMDTKAGEEGRQLDLELED